MDDFLAWFKLHGGEVSENIAINVFPDEEGGRGIITLKEILVGETLFTIPRSLLLSSRTSRLPQHMGEQDWKQFNLHKGWSGLILCLMWEEALGHASKWAGYFAWMPKSFSTLMFWSDEELKILEGSLITQKIGKNDAEREYYNRVLPAVQARPDLFLPHQSHFYTLESFHVAGSRMLSRSFTVHDLAEDEDGDIESDTTGDEDAQERDVSLSNLTESSGADMDTNGHEAEDSSDDEDEYSTTLVPMADMLNARSGRNNARLYHERDCLRMCATETIPAGQQIWNTYGDCPNADLLRRYGFVDLIPLNDGTLGNPADIAEVKADLVVKIAGASGDDARERIEWWLDQGGDDIFDIERSCNLPKAMVAFSRLLLMPNDEWEMMRSNDKSPKTKLDYTTVALAIRVIRARIAEYATTMEDDEALFPTLNPVTQWKERNAVAVRLGEKRILIGALKKCEEQALAQSQSDKPRRDKGHSGGSSSRKRLKR